MGDRNQQKRRIDLPSGLPKAELAATLVIGGCSAAFADLRLGVATWAVGLLLSLSQLRITQRLESELASVKRLAEIVDLNASTDVDVLRQLANAYVRVPDEEFAALKRNVVTAARDELIRLGIEKSSGELATGAYYRWLLPMLDRAEPGQHIRALSLMMECEWDDSPGEQRFLESNVRAAERGVQIDRVFVLPRAQLTNAAGHPAIRAHFDDNKPRLLRGHFVDLDRLRHDDSVLAAALGDGFIAFDSRVALIDLHSTDGSARGQVTKRAGTVAHLDDVFAELLVHSQPLSRELLKQEPLPAA